MTSLSSGDLGPRMDATNDYVRADTPSSTTLSAITTLAALESHSRDARIGMLGQCIPVDALDDDLGVQSNVSTTVSFDRLKAIRNEPIECLADVRRCVSAPCDP